MSYSRIFGSQFPNSVISVGSRKDVDNSVIDLINRYNGYVTDVVNAYETAVAVTDTQTPVGCGVIQYMNSKMLQIVSFNASTGQLVTKDYTR